LEIAKRLHIRVHEEDGCPLPEPRKLPEFSGQLRIRIPKSLHEELSRSAEREGISLNTYIVTLLSDQNRAAKIQKELRDIKNRFHDTILSGQFQSAWSSDTTIDKKIGSNFDDDQGSLCNPGAMSH
jgi:hypothetical protein